MILLELRSQSHGSSLVNILSPSGGAEEEPEPGELGARRVDAVTGVTDGPGQGSQGGPVRFSLLLANPSNPPRSIASPGPSPRSVCRPAEIIGPVRAKRPARFQVLSVSAGTDPGAPPGPGSRRSCLREARPSPARRAVGADRT